MLQVTVSEQGDLVKVTPKFNKAIFSHKYGRGDRREITKFTKRSRKNLLERFAIIDKELAGSATFLTLTYASNMQDDKLASSHLRNFFRRLEYETTRQWEQNDIKTVVGENMFYCWRKEYQDRGAIHFHIMVFRAKWIDKDWLAHAWGEITGDYTELTDSTGEVYYQPPFTRVEFCRSTRKTWYYLSKYVAKESKSGDGENVDLTSAQICRNENEPGRFWGWEGRKNIPYAAKVVARFVTTWQEYRRFRWDLRRVEEWTWKINLSDSVKFFKFDNVLSIAGVLLAGMEGRKMIDACNTLI